MKEIKLKTSGGDKKIVTMIPVTSSDGTKNPIKIIFKVKVNEKKTRS